MYETDSFTLWRDYIDDFVFAFFPKEGYKQNYESCFSFYPDKARLKGIKFQISQNPLQFPPIPLILYGLIN